MILWRFSLHESLDGRGGLIAAARWHSKGREILYCAQNPATALLEILVHADVRDPRALDRYRFLKIEVPDGVSSEAIDESQLPPDWSRRVRASRAWGDRWLQEGRSALLSVRSVLIPETYNLLVNPRHPEATHIVCIGSFPYPVDSRLLGRH